MDRAQILTKLNGVFRDIFDDDSIELTEATTAEDIEDWDSFNHINILAATEQTFRIKFQTAEVEGLRNVGELVSIIAKKAA